MKCNRFLSAIMLGIGLTLSLSCTKAFAQENIDTENQVVETQESQVSTYSETEKDGWQQENGYWYYYEYGSYLSNTMRELEDTQGVKGLYYFDSLGHMVTDQWITEGNTYYFGSNGKAYTGKQVIDGQNYLFDQNDSYLLKYYTGILNGAYFETDQNGTITYESEVREDGWVQIHDKWGFVQNGELLKEKWYQEDGIWYYFDWNGTTVIGFYNLYNDSTNSYVWYYFDENGHMVTNQWIENGGTYYFGSDGKAYVGKHNIDGENYLFSEDGSLQCYYIGVMDNVYYETNEKGIIIYELKIEKNGWNKVNEKWAYVNSDGTLKRNEWYQEDGIWYYFEWNYLTAVGRTQIYDNATDSYYYYHFDNNGHMLTDQWIEDEYEDYYVYYYGSDGRGYTGKHEINGINYYFSSNAYLLKNDTEFDNNIFYVTDDNGVIINEISATTKGWLEVGNRWAFVDENGEILRSTWYQENGYWYYFDWKGLSSIGLINLYYNEDTENYYYYFDDSSRMVTNQWIQDEYGECFYFGSNGRAYTGKQQINNNYYLFGNSYPNLYKSYNGIIDNVFYQTDENGIIVDEISIEGNGWLKIQDRWMYINEDGSYKQNEWYQEDGIWYYFDWNGFASIGMNNIYSESDDEYYYYFFDNNGHMLTNQWVYDDYYAYYVGANGRAYTKKQEINGINYLFGENYPDLQQNYFGIIDNTFYETDENGVIIDEIHIEGTGWVKIRDRWAYANSDGSLKQNEWYQENGIWYFFEWDNLAAIGLNQIYDMNTEMSYYYFFDNNGHMLTNQWIYDDYSTYYVGSNGRAYTGKNTINNYTYLFEIDYPRLLTNYEGLINNVYYKTNANGIIIDEQILNGDGWHKVDDRWVYLQNNQLLQETWYQENGIWYYFNWNGFATVGLDYIYSENTDEYKYYYFDNNGHMLTNYWLLRNNYPSISWMYFDNSGAAVTGIQEINNKNYYFDYSGCTLTNKNVVNNGVYYATNINGQIVETKTFKRNQWENVSGYWYYIDSNGNPYQGFKNINGQSYYFYDTGRMATGINSINGYIYSFGTNGHMIKNAWWQDLSYSTNEWYYFDNEGKGYNGWLNNVYYLDDGLMSTGLQIINDQYYLFDTNGHYITNHVFNNGWNLVDGYYYYCQDNKLLYGWQLINNVLYYLDEYTGQMASQSIENTETGTYYFNANGQYIKNAWQKIYENYIYAKADGHLARNEWLKINNTWYYFTDTIMANENMIIDNEYHLFNSNGAWLGESYFSGWVSDNGQWQYYVNNDFLTGWQFINGKYYYFSESGYAYSNDTYVIDNELFYFLDNCEMASTTGWLRTIYGEYVYLNNNHRVVTGWQKINGTWYYLEPIMSKGIVYIEGAYHQFAQNGTWLGEVNYENGWYKLENNYYYFRDGRLLNDEWIRSGSSYYYLVYSSGIMATGSSKGYYFDNSGKLLTNQWIHLSNGRWIYVDETGRIQYSKTLIIDGTKYSFDEYGYMI